MSPLIVFTFVIATALAAPQVFNPSVTHSIQPLAYAAPTPYHAQYQTGYNHVGYSAPAYKPYSSFAPAPVTAVKPYAAFGAAPVAPVAPFKAYAAPAAPAIQPYHAYHQYAGQPQHQYVGQPQHQYVGQPQHQYVKPIAIVRYNHDDNFDGSFTYDFEGENGISNQASGYVKAVGPKEQAQVMQGQYSYTAPDGTPIVTRWYADETGFHAEGAHLPENVAPYKAA